MSATAPAPRLKREQDYLGAARERWPGCASRPCRSRSRRTTRSRPSTSPAPSTCAPPRSSGRPLDHAVLRPDRLPRGHGRALVHRAPARRRHARATRWSSTGGPGMSTAFYRASRTEPMGVRLRRRFGAGPRARSRPTRTSTSRTGPSDDVPQPDPRRGDRAPARRADARHRRHDPARAGRDRPRRRRPDDLRAGRAGHRQDRGRPAPGGVAALRLPRPAGPLRRARRSVPTAPSSSTSAPCCRPSARSPSATPPSRSWSPSVPVRGSDATETAVLKGDARLAEVLRYAVWSRRAARDRAARGAARRAQVAGAGIRGQRDPRRAAVARRPLRRGAADAAAAARARRPARRWRAAATPRTTGCRTRWRAPPSCKKYVGDAVAGARRQGRCSSPCSRTPTTLDAPLAGS